jgi:hypothetical protein
MIDDPYLLKMGCEAILGPERERLRAFEHIIFETHPHITGVSNKKLLASLKELGFECGLHMVYYELKLNVNIYHCKSLGKSSVPKGRYFAVDIKKVTTNNSITQSASAKPRPLIASIVTYRPPTCFLSSGLTRNLT